MTIEDYIFALRALYGLHRAADDRLAECWPGRPRRAAHLAADLETLGVAPETLSHVAEMPPAVTNAHFLGIRYVVDGSTFGARLLALNVKQALGLDATSGARFLSASDGDTEWHALLMWLEQLEIPMGRDQACQAAERTFAAIERWLDQVASGAR